MSISISAIGGGTSTNGGDITVTLGAGNVSPGDLVIVAYAIGDNDDVDFNMAMVTAGYTEITDLFSNDTRDTNLGVFYKFMGSPVDADYTVDGQGGADASVATVYMAFSGVDQVTPFDVASTTATGINTYVVNPPSINHNGTPGIWTVIVGASAHDLGGFESYAPPSGYTGPPPVSDFTQQHADDTTDIALAMGYRTDPSDPEDPGTFGLGSPDSVNYSWCAVTMALRPDSTRRGVITWAELEVPDVAATATRLRTLMGVGT